MKKNSVCDFEKTIVKSVKAGLVGDEVSEHLEACADCRETAKIVRFFQRNLTLEAPPKPLPTAGFIWWKFQLNEKRRSIERVNQPISIAQTAAAVVVLGMIGWLIFNRSAHLPSIATTFDRIFDSFEVIAVPFSIGVICLSFVCAGLVFTLRRLLPDK